MTILVVLVGLIAVSWETPPPWPWVALMAAATAMVLIQA
jgi:hypothetical protein